MPSQTCLLLVFGIPATGKSSLVKELLSRTDSWPATAKESGAQCVHVCFDDFYPSDNREIQMYVSCTCMVICALYYWLVYVN